METARGGVTQRYSKGLDRSWSSALVAAAIAIGLILPDLSALLSPYVFHALFVVVVFSICMLPERPIRVFRHIDPFTFRIALWQMFIVPAIITVFTITMDPPRILVLVLLLTATAGSVFASPALVSMIGLDRQIATRSMILSTLLTPVSVFLFAEINGILTFDVSLELFALHIGHFIIVPVTISVLFWEMKPDLGARARERIDSVMHWGSTIGLIIFCIGIMTTINGAGYQIAKVTWYAVIALCVSLVLFGTTTVLFSRFGVKKALVAGMLTSNRNVALGVALLGSSLPPEIMTYVAVSQFPIFFMPLFFRILTRGHGFSIETPAQEQMEKNI